MAHGEFVWCDLSTFRPDTTLRFYTKLFGWSYESLSQPDGTDYAVAAPRSTPTAGLYEMPAKFVDMGMPSFWMPYINVDDIQTTCDTALAQGGRVEVGPIDWGEFGQVALIRDPLGAGFTVTQGGMADTSAIKSSPGHAMAFALYVSDIQAIKEFYTAIFDWTFSPKSASDSCDVHAKSGSQVAKVHELPDQDRGKEQFWSIQFAVADLSQSKATLLKNGGEVLYEEKHTLLARDPDGAAFFLAETTPAPSAQKPATKWRTFLGLAVVYIALFTDQNWVWGILFLLWTLPALRSGETHFVEPISRRETPGLFWLLILTWIGTSLLLFWYGWGV
jgi:predicted enzyme related to lactoylglutathione lyase